MTNQEIAQKLAAYCRKGQWEAAQKELYAQNAVSIEQEGSLVFEKETKGLPAIIEKGHTFDAMIEKVYSYEASEPIVAGDAFAFVLTMDLDMKGRGRAKMSELAVYTAENGKIVSEQFFN
jgi:hypothetical protein